MFGDASLEPKGMATRRERTLHEVVLRAQRNGLAYRHVSCLFGAALRSLLSEESAIGATGTLQLSSHSALDYLLRVVARARTAWCRLDSACDGDAAPPRIVWAHDEAQGLLDVATLPSDIFDGVFSGPLDEAGSSTVAGVRRGCFYGLLAAVREVTTVLQSGHLLLGTSLDMTGEILNKHSPAQGIADAVEVAEHFDVPALRNWLGHLLSPAAFAGVTDEALELLRGRPLFASLFWTMLVAGCNNTGDMTPANRVKDALKCAYVSSTKSAATRISALWMRHLPVADGHVPSRLLRFLFHELIMATGKHADWRAMHLQVGVRECIQRGILNASSDGDIVLDAEPATARALREEGIKRLLDGNDGILTLLAGRVTEPGGGEVADYGPAQEACFAWLLVRACMLKRGRGQPPPLLRELLAPFLAHDVSMLNVSGTVPAELDDYEVMLDHGHRADTDDGLTRCPLALLVENPTTLVHHPPNRMGGPDIMFLARHRTRRLLRLVLLQLKNRATGSLTDALRSVDLGACHADSRGHESCGHADMRRVLAMRPSWALPIRGVVGARPISRGVLLDVAWLNQSKLAVSPLLLMRLTNANVGASICPPGADEVKYDRVDMWPRALWPSPIRYWPVDAATLPSLDWLPWNLPGPIASLHVLFESIAPHNDIIAAVEASARAFGGTVEWVKHRWLVFGPRKTTATFSLAAAAFNAVQTAAAKALRTTSGATISAAFV